MGRSINKQISTTSTSSSPSITFITNQYKDVYSGLNTLHFPKLK